MHSLKLLKETFFLSSTWIVGYIRHNKFSSSSCNAQLNEWYHHLQTAETRQVSIFFISSSFFTLYNYQILSFLPSDYFLNYSFFFIPACSNQNLTLRYGNSFSHSYLPSIQNSILICKSDYVNLFLSLKV